jgi:hypothetical protein
MHRWFNTQQVTLVPELNSENVRRISSDAISAAAHCVSHSDGAEWPLHLRWCELAHHNNLLSTVLQYETLILCCIVTPTGQLTRRLLYRLLHRLGVSGTLVGAFLRLGHCRLCAALSCFTEWCIRCLSVTLLFASSALLYSVL